jgi:hypothetical protein
MNSGDAILDQSAVDALRGLPSPDPRGMLVVVTELFGNDSPPLFAKVDAALNDGRLDLARSGAHALKSYAGTVGAISLRSALVALERACQMGDAMGAQGCFVTAREAYGRALGALRSQLSTD